MAALVQTYPQQPSPVAMLQTRPSSGSGLQASSHQYSGSQSQRDNFQGRSASGGNAASYRNTGPIKPYAFTSTPSLNNSTSQWQQFGTSKPSPTSGQPTLRPDEQGRTAAMGMGVTGSRDDSAISQRRPISLAPRPQSSYMANTSSPQLLFSQVAPVRAPPDRYRRAGLAQHGRSQSGQLAGSGSDSQLYMTPTASPVSNRSSMPPGGRPSTMSRSAVDDTEMILRQHSQDEKRLRRRSMHTIDSADYPNPLTPQLFKRTEEANRVTGTPSGMGKHRSTTARLPPNPARQNNMQHNRNNSSESAVSSRSSHSRPSVSTIHTLSLLPVVSRKSRSFGPLSKNRQSAVMKTRR